jgi:predicted dehydrogenase
MKLFLVGTGGIAHRHVEALQRIPETAIAGVCDLDRARAEQFVAKHQLPARVYPDVAAGLDAVKPAAVVLLTPRHVRLPVVKLCVERHLPLLMEKPPCHSLAVGNEIKELLTQSGLIHSVGFPTRYEPSLRAALTKIAGERLALIQILLTSPMATQPVLAAYPDPYLIERSGGLAGDQGIHYVDVARYIARSEVKTVRALGTNRVLPVSPQVTTRDTAGWVLEMQNGIVVTHAHTWGAANWTCQIRLVTDHSNVTVDGFGDVLGQFEGEHRAFHAAVARGNIQPVLSSYADALESFRVTEEINRQLYANPMAT